MDGSWAELARFHSLDRAALDKLAALSVWLDEAMLCSRQAGWGADGRYSWLILAWDQRDTRLSISL